MSNAPDMMMAWTTRNSGLPDHVLTNVDASRFYPMSQIYPSVRGKLESTTSLGAIDRLPVETIVNIIIYLDIVSLTAFRQVNRRALTVVNSIPQYRKISEHCRDIIRCALNISASHFDLQTLYNTLCSTRCTTCKDYGGYIYLITCTRVCMNCFYERRRFLPLSVEDAARITRLPQKTLLQKFPNIWSAPGRYGALGTMCIKRRMLLDRPSVMATLTDEAAATAELVLEVDDRDLEQYDPRRHMGIVCAPYFELPAKTLRWGLYCLGCRDFIESEFLFRKQYTREGFVEHISLYGPVTRVTGGDLLIHVRPKMITD